MVAKKQKRKNCTYRRARREGNRIKHARRRLLYASGRCTNNNINQICQPKGPIPLFRYTRSLISLRIRYISILSIHSGRGRPEFGKRVDILGPSIGEWSVEKKRERESLLLFRSIEFSGLLSYYDNREILSMEK